MAAQQPRPGVEVIQEFRSTSPTIVIPTLVPCNVAPFFEIIEVLAPDGTLNEDSKLASPYAQLPLTIAQSSFPAPRGNVDQLDIQEDTVRAFLDFGGTLLELSRTSGFLASLNVATNPVADGTVAGPYNLDGKKLRLVLDGHQAVGGGAPTTVPVADIVEIEFEEDSMPLADVIDFINARIPGIATDDGASHLRLKSTKYGAGASVFLAIGSANSAFGYSALKDQIAVGAGFYAIDDADGDLVSPRIEFYGGTTLRDIDVADLGPIAAPNFNDFFIEVGDSVVAGGVSIGNVTQVFSDRLVMSVEQNIFGADAPFAPRYFWVQGNGLVFPAPASSTPAEVTGSNASVAETSAFVVPQSAFALPVGAGETIELDVVVDGVAQATEVISSGTGWTLITDVLDGTTGLNQGVNFEAYASNDVGDEVNSAVATHIGFRTEATNRGSAAAVTISDASVGMKTALGLGTLPIGDVGENYRFLTGTPGIMAGGNGSSWNAGGGGGTLGGAAAINFTVTVNGVVKDGTGGQPGPESLTLSAHADTLVGLQGMVDEFNSLSLWAEAYRSDAAGIEDATSGEYLSVRTRGENVGLDASIQFTGGTDVAFFGGAAIHTGTGAPPAGTAPDLNGAEFQWQMDGNTKTYSVLFAADEDDGSVSLQQVVDAINAETPGVASMGTAVPPALVLTSLMSGEQSAVTILSGSANGTLGFSPGTTNGSGRPLPDFAIDTSGNARVQGQILRDGLSGAPFANSGAPLHMSYKALRLDLSPDADDPALLVINDTEALETLAAPISSDNPGALMTFLTLINSPGTSATAIGVPEVSADAPDGTPAGYAKAFEFLESEEVYAISLGTQEGVVHQAGLTHVNFMSEPEQKGERILFFNPVIPDRALNDLLASGNDANTSATSNLITVDVNVAPQLIEQGLDPSEINPTTGPIVNEVFVDVAADDNIYLVQRVENGTDIYVRTVFASGDGNDDQFYSTTSPTGLISDDWTLAIRGTQLLLPGTTDPDKDRIAETIQATGQAYGFRRGFYVFPDQVGINVTGLEQIVPGYYAASCILGMVASLPPQQGFTNFPITGLTQVVKSNSYFSERQLNVIAAGGVYILVQDAEGAPVSCRHQLSTDMSSIEVRELSITKVVDFTAKFLRGALRNFIGRSNITQSFLDQLSSVVQGVLSFLIESGVLIGADVNNVIQDADAPDTVLIDVTMDVPYPCNYIRITLVI
jgi:hypothetical protein